MIDKELDIMINKIIKVCESWIKTKDKQMYFEDPLEKKEIVGHYGTSHLSAALIIYGEESGNVELTQTGLLLLESMLKRWDIMKIQPDFHNDFNNFALCLVEKYLKKEEKNKLLNQIKTIVLTTGDSNHQTVNWLPMRAYVNFCRFNWTKDKKYKDAGLKCLEEIKKATFNDGFIDDRLPIGLSYNLQYNVATVAVMQLLNNIGLEVDITKELSALLSVISPDGDINYLGRGTNQIFAWGMWMYVLCSSGRLESEQAFLYLNKYMDVILEENNIMLNTWSGKEKFLWWDYHYCSVYTAHLLLWLVLALRDHKKFLIDAKETKISGESGVNVYKNNNFFVVTFDGREEYLAERGPVVANFWVSGIGCIVKGTFGPWRGAFGNKYINNEIINNYFGIIEIKYNRDFSKNRILKRLHFNMKNNQFIKKTPCFMPLNLNLNERKIIFQWESEEEKEAYLNIPVLMQSKEIIDSLKIYIDDVPVLFDVSLCIRNQYDWCLLVTSKTSKGRKWRVEIAI